MGEHREAAAFCLGQTPLAATELGFEDAVFREEIRDDLLLVTLKPAGDQHDQDMQDHERSSDWRQWRHRSAQYTTNRRNFNRPVSSNGTESYATLCPDLPSLTLPAGHNSTLSHTQSRA